MLLNANAINTAILNGTSSQKALFDASTKAILYNIALSANGLVYPIVNADPFLYNIALSGSWIAGGVKVSANALNYAISLSANVDIGQVAIVANADPILYSVELSATTVTGGVTVNAPPIRYIVTLNADPSVSVSVSALPITYTINLQGEFVGTGTLGDIVEPSYVSLTAVQSILSVTAIQTIESVTPLQNI